MSSVRVVIPVYKAQATLERCLVSVKKNAFCSLHVVLAVDDGDDYSAWCGPFEGGIVDAVRTSAARSGPSAARNAGLRGLAEDFVAFCDADDQWSEGRLERLCALAGPGGAAVDNTTVIGPDGTPLRQAKTCQPPGDALNLMTLLGARLPFFSVVGCGVPIPDWPDLRFAEDLVFNLQLLEQRGLRFSAETSYLYHVNAASISASADIGPRMADAYRAILAGLDAGQWFETPAIATALRRQIHLDRETNTEFLSGGLAGETLNEFVARKKSETTQNQ